MNTDKGTILVTGAAGDIGGGIVRRLAGAGYRVIGTDISPARRDTACSTWIEADLARPEGRAAVVGGVEGTLRGFVHAAGVILTQSLAEVTDSDFDLSHAVNVKAAFFLTRDLLPRFTNGSSVVMIGSVAGQRASPENLVYASTKAALRSAASSLAVALAPKGVRINVVAPGLIETATSVESTKALSRLRSTSRDDVWRARIGGIPQQRAGSVVDVANAVSWLISDESGYVTGSTLAVNGGLMAGS